MRPFFSIIIPLYNKENHIKSTLEHVLAQTFKDFEIIVINDGSTDKSKTVVERIKDDRLKLLNIKNQGVSHARNYGIEKASSNLIVFLDADDLWRNNHLTNLKALYTAFPNCGLYATAYQKKNNKITISSVYNHISSTKNWMGIVDNYFESSVVNSIAWTSAVMIPKSIFETIGNFNENITLGAGEDTDLWIRIALKYPVAFSTKVTAIYILHSDNRISKSNTSLRQFLDLDVYENEANCNASLKKYLDLNRFSIAIQYKLAGNPNKAKSLIDKIDATNLNTKQRSLLKLNSTALKCLLNIKNRLQNSGILLSSYK
ncbi:glycosyltransferase family 2 protein [Gelidibacter salicanalis]|uniref:Glycosyltransferase family 2 protein n=1 Tax=Gelidibacter salicanalis TaxID=291193 RepID=A0A934KPU4_9FLAO|nr:glycosyltransferase family A protein [Gelidibacter salicanalis]MBJ7879251.1 glycosyltransferase family 2 protein [Gelidibacter salicanalis]